jgi:general secretion pathway protein D
MISRITFVSITILFFCLGNPASAEDEQQVRAQQIPRTALMDLLTAVSKKTGDTFVVDRRVDADVVLGQVETHRVDYSTLLVILRNNELAAIRRNGLVSVVPVQTIRQRALPILNGLDEAVDDEEWVSMAVDVHNATATQFVPILRPLLPQPSHMIAHSESNTIFIVGRYANIKRLVELIRRMDEATTKQ